MDILDHLSEEHETIKGLIKELQSASRDVLPELLNRISYLVEDVHHSKEEKLLFPEVVKHVKAQHGGPRCTFFMGLRIDDDVTKRILVFLNDNHMKVDAHTQTDLCDQLIVENHPLSLPLSEHIAGCALMDFMKTMPEENILSKAIDLYSELLLLHIAKEDTCLFEMLKQVLSPPMREELGQKASALP